MTRDVDVAIIGAGSAGLFAMGQVKRETDNFVLINGGELGTTCARVGCMPSMVIIQVAEDFHRKNIFGREGVDGAESLSVGMPAVMEYVQDLRDPLTMQLENLPIFIAGDVNADRPLLHEAGHEGRAAGYHFLRPEYR